MDFSQILDIAIQECERYYTPYWQYFYQIYPFTTENISGYINEFNLDNTSLLTVGSSCDQILNAILLGSIDITSLDINPFTKYYYYLKVASILELNIDYYLLFLRYKDYPKVFKNNNFVFNKEIFNAISKTLRLLDYESYLFWSDLLNMFNPLTIRNYLFFQDEDRDSILKQTNLYLSNEKNYKTLRNKITKIKPSFITDDIKTVNLNKTYDNIWLSNIFSYDYSLKDIKEICTKFDNYLNNNGKMMISYIYDLTKDTKYMSNWTDIYNLEKVFNTLKDYNPYLLTFTGVRGILFNDNNYCKDSVLIYKKNK